MVLYFKHSMVESKAMEDQHKLIDITLTFILGLGNMLITYVDIVSKFVALVVAILSGGYIIWRWRRDIKKYRDERHYDLQKIEDE